MHTVEQTPSRVPKICGFDCEVGNVDPLRSDRGRHASWLLLRGIPGVPAGLFQQHAQDSGRRFLPETGASAYIDLQHLELAGPECASAFDLCAAFHAMLDVTRDAALEANAGRPAGERIRVHANNSDGHGESWGGHLSVLLSRPAFRWIFGERLHYLLYLASAQVSSVVFSGQGKAGAENGAPPVRFQLSQRADFFECLVAERTTFARPLVNCRNESLACAESLARLHCIFFDTTLCHTATILRTGFMQLMLALIEAEQVDPLLIFENPLEALRDFSHDPSLRSEARLLSGRRVTALEHQYLLLETAARFVEAGGTDGFVPRAREILAIWEEILNALAGRNWDALFPRLDWVAKRQLLDQTAARCSGGWDAPQVKVLDHVWSDLEDGAFTGLAAAEAMERRVSKGEVERARNQPPADTRACGRALLLQRFAEKVRAVDWDAVTLWHRGDRLEIPLPNPAGATMAELAGAADLDDDELLAFLGARPAAPACRIHTPAEADYGTHYST